jgi:hypothetical protein
MNLSDTFYVALCMTILILGAVYWFWTQNQFMMRKLNLLENIVYEMKAALPPAWASGDLHPGAFGQQPSPVPSEPLGSNEAPTTQYAPAPGSVMSEEDVDVLHEDLSHGVAQSSPVLEISNSFPHEVATAANDLQPGGVGSGIDEQEAKAATTYDNMTRKDLIRMAESRGINVSPNMRKQALIDALKALPFNGGINTQLQTNEPSLTISDEGVLDLS